MNNILKFALWGFGVFAGLIVVALIVIWTVSSIKLNKKYDAPELALAHSKEADVIAEGKRLATITGCTGCHSKDMQGYLLAELPDGTKIVAPNIPRIAAASSDDDLARVIKYGVRPDKSGVMVMPADALIALTDNDLTAILSYIRATPDNGGDLPKSSYGLLIRFLLATGEFKPAPLKIDDMTKPPTFNQGDPLERGAYLARISCAECHGLDLKGQTWPDGTVIPDLLIATAYSIDEFKHLMKTGIGKNNRDLGLMSEVAQDRFDAFTEDEVEAVHAFLMDRVMNSQ